MGKAAEFTARPNNHDFAASKVWFRRFCKRHNPVFCTVSGKSKDVNVEMCLMWTSGTLQDYLDGYSPYDTSNADETAPFFEL